MWLWGWLLGIQTVVNSFRRHSMLLGLRRQIETRFRRHHLSLLNVANYLHQSTRRLYSAPSKAKGDVIFSGIQPTGVPHLGNYLGALQQWSRLQDESLQSTQLLYSIVDLHAITINQDADQLRKWRRETMASLLAVGLDPERSSIFYQSAVRFFVLCLWAEGLSNIIAGSRAYGVNVDTQLYGTCWLSFPHDTVEGLRSGRTFERVKNIG